MMRLCPKDGIKTEQERCPECGTATLVLAQNPDSKLSEGTEVNGRYRIDKLIGQGGFGAVYKATHLATDQEMAIKVLGISLDSDESDLIQRFFAEAQITAGLKHPNTIRVFDFGQTEGGALYIAMELLNGNDLNEILKERKEDGRAMSEEETIRVASQTLRSLAEAHMAGLVHRDLKPHNIFLNEVPGDDPVVKVLDFGIAKRLGSNLTGTGQAFGTPNYMSPEQAQNRPIDARSDLYSLGIVMYQCVTMRCPFEGDNPLAVLLSHVTDPPPDLREVSSVPLSEEFIGIIEKALAKDPFDRFESAIDMRRALSGIGRVSRETMVTTGAVIGDVAGESKIADGSGKEQFSKTGDSARLNLDEGANEEAPTQAYDVQRLSAKVTQSSGIEVSEAAEPNATNAYAIDALSDKIAAARKASGKPDVTMDGEGSGFTEAFMGLGEVIAEEAAKASPPADDPLEVATKSKSSKGAMALIALVLLAAIGVGVALSGGEEQTSAATEQQDPAAVAAEDPNAEAAANTDEQAEAPSGADAGSASEGKAETKADAGGAKPADDAGAAAQDAAPAAPTVKVVAVELKTDPPGADVLVNGAKLGKTPLTLKVEENKPLTGKLNKAGFHGKDFFVLHTDAPAKTIQLNKKVVVIARPKKAKPAPTRPKPKRPSKPTTSALEERL